MKYNLIQPNPKQTTDFDNIQNTILLNRGVEQPEHYLNTTDEDIIHYSKLNNISKAVEIFNKAIADKVGIYIIADPDMDGVCASSILYQYIKETYGVECGYYIHTGKEHGISKDILPQILSDIKEKKFGLLIVPDAGSGDIKESKQIRSLGCEIITLDHHEVPIDNEYTCLVNPQLSNDYDNKFLSGCGTVWKFLLALDDDGWTNNADKYIDLVATSIISDSMDLRTFENKRLVEKGLSSINNKMLKSFLDEQAYSIKDEITPTAISFYVAPLVNSLVRVGTEEEKDLMFKAFCQIDQSFEYKKRDGSIVQESIYERVARLATNARSRQNRAIEKGMEIVEADIETNNRNNNKILFALAGDEIDRNFTGLVAMRLASKFNKPCILLRENERGLFAGSGRNFNGSPLTDLKGFLQSFGYLNWAAGHSSAFGCSMTKKQLIKTIELSNEKLKEYDFTPVHQIDFSFTPDDLTTYILSDLYSMRHHYGQQIPEALLLIKNIKLNSSQIQFLGKSEEKNTWKFPLTSNIDIIKFRIDKSDILSVKYGGELSGWGGEDIEMNVICKVGMNNFNGESKYQLIVQDFELL
jgi:single-stranded-DNA-specific exonuclease